MSESHKVFCEKLGNTTYKLNDKTIKQQDEFFQRKLGISRENVVNMEEDKFHELIERKSGKKIGYDKNIKIDRCTPITLEEKEKNEGEK